MPFLVKIYSVYIGETGRLIEPRLEELITAFKKGKLISKIVQISLEAYRIQPFTNVSILK